MLSDLWVIAAAIMILAGLLASQLLLIVVGVLILLIWATGKHWPRYAFSRLTYRRRLERRRAFIGDVVDYYITVDNGKVLPMIWLDISDAFPIGLQTGGTHQRGVGAEAELDHRITTSLLPYQRVTWRYRVRCRARGNHRIGPARLRSGDMFGISAAEKHVPDVEYLLVYPRIVDLRQLMNLWERPLGASRGRRLIQDDPSRFVGLRDYRPTDPLKRIDWKATARHGKVEARIFEPAATRHMLIALNARTGDAAWQGSNRRLFERAVTVAASVAEYAEREGYTFGLVSNAVASYSSKWMSVPPGGGSLQLEAVLESLAMAGPLLGRRAVGGAAQRERRPGFRRHGGGGNRHTVPGGGARDRTDSAARPSRSRVLRRRRPAGSRGRRPAGRGAGVPGGLQPDQPRGRLAGRLGRGAGGRAGDGAGVR